MSDLKYDKDNLEFTEDRKSFGKILLVVGKYFVMSIFLAVLYYVVFALFISTDREKRMMAESRLIARQYDMLEDKVEILEGTVSGLEAADEEIYYEVFNSYIPDYTGYYYTDSSAFYHRDTTYGSAIVFSSMERLKGLSSRFSACAALLGEVIDTVNSHARKDALTSYPSIVPINDFPIMSTGASVGRRMHPFYKEVTYHSGLDLVAPAGTEVVASADGTVLAVDRSKKLQGNRVTIDHGNGYTTVYAHLSDIFVRKGQKVRQGAVIAEVGNSGTSFAPHLHYEVVLNGKHVDPLNYFFGELTPDQYRQMMTVAMNTGQSLD